MPTAMTTTVAAPSSTFDADLIRLPYTRQVVDESMRLYPPGWLLTRRSIGPDLDSSRAPPFRRRTRIVDSQARRGAPGGVNARRGRSGRLGFRFLIAPARSPVFDAASWLLLPVTG